MACGILVPQPGIELVPLAVEAQVLTTGSTGKSSVIHFKDNSYWINYDMVCMFVCVYLLLFYLFSCYSQFPHV